MISVLCNNAGKEEESDASDVEVIPRSKSKKFCHRDDKDRFGYTAKKRVPFINKLTVSDDWANSSPSTSYSNSAYNSPAQVNLG